MSYTGFAINKNEYVRFPNRKCWYTKKNTALYQILYRMYCYTQDLYKQNIVTRFS